MYKIYKIDIYFHMNNKTNYPIIFLRRIYSDSIPDLANLLVAEAEDNYDTIIKYLLDIRLKIDEWIKELQTEKENEK